ncbi:MAG TPA: V-type ATPase subunit [Thermodesulfovibrionales bacterium]|nr:V-type ATPase subunit [Thermodesulfovibrionales bacterium]
MQLLQEIEDRGYPTEYLLARIRGRRASLINDWESFLMGAATAEFLPSHHKDFAPDASSHGQWRHLLKEFRWVYYQMNRKLSKIYSPFFLYAELKTIFFFFRYRVANEQTKWEQLFNVSLLSKKCKTRLKNSEDIHDAVRMVEDLLVPFSLMFKGIGEMFLEQGLQGVEWWLANRYLEHVMTGRLHPVIRKFFVRTIDSRNLITLYKLLRWDMKREQEFVKGGSINAHTMQSTAVRGDMFHVLRMIRKLTGVAVESPDATSVEKAIYKGMTHSLRREGRDPSGVALILDYLWKCSMEVRNLGVLIHGEGIDSDTLRAELVL